MYQTRESDGPFNLEVNPAEGGFVGVVPELDTYPDGTEVTLTATPDENYVFDAWKHMSGANPYTFTIRKNTVKAHTRRLLCPIKLHREYPSDRPH